MSPEQITGGDVDARSDVFSLGVVIFQMATGHLPFSGSNREELMEAILRMAPESMTGLNPDVASELERVTFKCLEKAAEDRYQSARELLGDLWPIKRQLDATRAMVDSPWFELLRRPVDIADESPGCEASDLVARGWAHLRSGCFFELSDAVSAFVAATEVAPAYAAAHAGLALTKVAQATAHDVSHLEALAEAKTMALRALALNDKSAEAQVALGQVMLFSEMGLDRGGAQLPAGAGDQPESRGSDQPRPAPLLQHTMHEASKDAESAGIGHDTRDRDFRSMREKERDPACS